MIWHEVNSPNRRGRPECKNYEKPRAWTGLRDEMGYCSHCAAIQLVVLRMARHRCIEEQHPVDALLHAPNNRRSVAADYLRLSIGETFIAQELKQFGIVADAQLAHGIPLLPTDGGDAAVQLHGDLGYRQARGQ